MGLLLPAMGPNHALPALCLVTLMDPPSPVHREPFLSLPLWPKLKWLDLPGPYSY